MKVADVRTQESRNVVGVSWLGNCILKHTFSSFSAV